MNIFIEDTYEAISAKAANDALKLIAPVKKPVLCTASGDSPKGLYRNLIQAIKQRNLDISDWYFVGLDEWLGMNATDEGSCRFHLDHDLFHPLEVSTPHICFFNGKAPDPISEARKTDNFIRSHGGIVLAIVGLGMNGHVGMNEPGTDPSLHCHVADIAPSTQAVGQKYFREKQSITKGLTLGIANLMEAKGVFLIVSGEKKSSIIKQVLEGPVSEQFPASLLRNHKNLYIYLDKPAACLLQTNKI